jgi:hypothetical protein
MLADLFVVGKVYIGPRDCIAHCFNQRFANRLERQPMQRDAIARSGAHLPHRLRRPFHPHQDCARHGEQQKQNDKLVRGNKDPFQFSSV